MKRTAWPVHLEGRQTEQPPKEHKTAEGVQEAAEDKEENSVTLKNRRPGVLSLSPEQRAHNQDPYSLRLAGTSLCGQRN
jgi:hypothetical protein